MKRVLVLAAAAIVALGVPAIPAHAQARLGSDPVGDTVGDPLGAAAADVTDFAADYSDGVITLAMTVSSPHSPETDPNWVVNDTWARWRIAVGGLGDHHVLLFNDGEEVVAGLYRTFDDTLVCEVLHGFEDNSFFAAFDADCLGHPMWLSVNANFLYDTGDEHPAYDETAFIGPLQETLTPAPGSGYWMITEAGRVHAFGQASLCGEHTVLDPAVDGATDIEPYPFWVGEMHGYWTLDAAGYVEPHTCGLTSGTADPFFLGEIGGRLPAGETAVSLSATPTGAGYWIFTSKGNVFAYGDARFYGSMGNAVLNAPVLDSVVTPSGKGYWMVAADGGIFTFGDARFMGSMGGTPLNKPVVSMAPDPDGDGYWLVAADGGIFAFGAPFYGSTGHLSLNKPVTGMVTGPAGYLMVGEDGGIFAFGDVKFHGSMGANPPPSPVAAVALVV